MTKANAKVRRAAKRSAERALMEERLAIGAIVKVMLLEASDPERVLARLDAMARGAEMNPRIPANVRRRLLDATRFVRTAIQRERRQQQELLDPHIGHVNPRDVDALVAPTDGPQQLGLIGNDSVLGDVEAAHETRVATIEAVHTALVAILKDGGAMTDWELHTAYLLYAGRTGTLPHQSPKAICDRRKELQAAGRIIDVRPVGPSGRREGAGRFDIIERETTPAVPTEPKNEDTV